MIHRTSLVSLALLVSLAACGKKKDAEPTPGSAVPTPGSAAPTPGSAAAPTPGSAAAPTPGSAAAPTPGSAAAPTPGSAAPHPAQAITAIVEGATCPSGTTRVTDAPLTIAGATASLVRSRGGGCPQKPVYTLVYTKASPTELRLCFDPTADVCEMMIMDEKVAFDLTAALAAAGATAAVAGK